MKFLVDAHLPFSLCNLLSRHGHQVLHTRELPQGNATKDEVINQLSIDDEWIVLSKDADFFYSHILHGRPWKLLLVETGNISTRDLTALIERNLPAIESALQHYTLIEIDRVSVKPVL